MIASRHVFSPATMLAFVWLGLLSFISITHAATKIESVQQYDARLAQAEEALHRMEQGTARPLAPVLQGLARTSVSVQVKRADGQTQSADSDEWTRLLKGVKGNATREQVRQARETIALRRRALAIWAGTGNETTMPPSGQATGDERTSDLFRNGSVDSQAMVRQLEANGQIRTGPTQMEQMISDAKKWLKETLKAFFDWIGSLFPSNPNAQPPKIDWRLVKFLFWISVFALLLVIGYLVWKAVGGRLGRPAARRLVRFEGSEDSELLVLPPDELRQRARQLAAGGNFREALRHLYIALLLTLDARGVWHYDTRRTNWEHIAALRGDPARLPMVAPLSDLTRRFDRVRYGNAACDNTDWTRFERDVTQLEQQTPQQTPQQSTPATPQS